ncbi:winged helix-turn-helix transcriptional regulator [Aurantiacibacter hainanensis]|uniref:winged helix-turn-helix transcriptional regulator n=1 Tax=Aurantiacibacter hainanensis TaxID=3076114 RepID=UPI0030C702D8
MLDPETHCPATKASELIRDKWVLQIIRTMMMGARRYGDLTDAIPRISPAVLSARLKTMAEQGLIVKRQTSGLKSATYRLTPSGRELRPIIEHLAVWGLKWAARNVRDRNIDIGAMMWDIHKTLRTRELPDGETVISIALRDAENFKSWWLVANGRKVDLCSDNPGKDVTIYLSCEIGGLLRIWRGDVLAQEMIENGEMVVDGPSDLITTLDRWMPLSPLATRRSEV